MSFGFILNNFFSRRCGFSFVHIATKYTPFLYKIISDCGQKNYIQQGSFVTWKSLNRNRFASLNSKIYLHIFVTLQRFRLAACCGGAGDAALPAIGHRQIYASWNTCSWCQRQSVKHTHKRALDLTKNFINLRAILFRNISFWTLLFVNGFQFETLLYSYLVELSKVSITNPQFSLAIAGVTLGGARNSI